MSAIRYVSVDMIVRHTGKKLPTVHHALKNAKVKTEKIPGVKGLRISLKDANDFIMRQWPHIAPMQAPQPKVLEPAS